MKRTQKMTCPECGVPMNHHAEKLDYTAALEHPQAADPVLGGVMYEIHACTECGKSAVRRPA